MTAVYVIPPFMPIAYGDAAVYVPAAAKQARVRCTARLVTAVQTHQGILRVARTARCDAIAMASHGRGGLAGVLRVREHARGLGAGAALGDRPSGLSHYSRSLCSSRGSLGTLSRVKYTRPISRLSVVSTCTFQRPGW